MKLKVTSLLTAILLLNFTFVNSANAAGILVDCAESPGFTKRLNASVKKLESRPLPKFERNLLLYLAETPLRQQVPFALNLGARPTFLLVLLSQLIILPFLFLNE